MGWRVNDYDLRLLVSTREQAVSYLYVREVLCQDGGSGDGGRATMERVPNRRWTESTVGSKELVKVEQDRAGIATMA